jgi:predicted nucleic acid-binding protein
VIRNVLVDTGPLLALIDQRDQYHSWVEGQFARIVPPLLTCEPVLTETCYLAGRVQGGTSAVMELFERGVVALAFDLAEHLAPVASLMHRYASVPMSLADACLVRMSELSAGHVVLTLDGDFHVYRRHKRQRIPVLMPSRG